MRRSSRLCIRRLFVLGLAVAAYFVGNEPRKSHGCPFCAAVQATLSEEMQSTDVTVICTLVDRPPAAAEYGASMEECTFEVNEVLKGDAVSTAVPGLSKPYRIKILYFDEQPVGSRFLAFGVDPANLVWGTPTLLTDRSLAYVKRLSGLNQAANRLAFFTDYFEDVDPLLAGDAYDEFARAPYTDLLELRHQLPRQKLLSWIDDANVTTAHRRLYLCLLSICGRPEDVHHLETLIRRCDRTVQPALDALIGCYLALTGEAGLPLIEKLFLENADAEYTNTYAAVMALRFIGQDTKAVSHARLMQAFRHMLKRPMLADLVIPDLTRGEDWTVVPELVALFKRADAKDETLWARIPIVNYLRACPLPEAKIHLQELATLDPDSVRKADFFFGGAAEPLTGSVRSAADQK